MPAFRKTFSVLYLTVSVATWAEQSDVESVFSLLEETSAVVEIGEGWKLAEDGVYTLEEVVVVGEYVEEEKSFPSVLEKRAVDDSGLLFGTASSSVLAGEELQRSLRATLGDTLAGQPGVSASSYSAGASRPIIRGLDGFRVATLLDGLGTLDLSQESPDHGVAIDTALAESIEIYRGPSALRFGSGAIGGAVNTVTRLRPTLVPEGEWGIFSSVSYKSQGNGTHAALGASVADGPWALSFYRGQHEAGDISIPGRARTNLYDEILEPVVRVSNEVDGRRAVPNPDGTLPNSFHESETNTIGVSLGPTDFFEAGVSFSQFTSTYGIPYFFDGSFSGLPFGETSIDTELTRFDAEFSFTPQGSWGPISEATLRFADGRYHHAENFEGLNFEGFQVNEGTDFTQVEFDRRSRETRLEFHNGDENSFLRGISGLHVASNEVLATRVPNFQVPDQTNTLFLEQEVTGVYTTQKLFWRELSLEYGLRGEFGRVSAVDTASTAPGFEEQTSTLSQSVTLGWQTERIPGLKNLGMNFTLSMSERAPSAVERYAFWENEALGNIVIGGDIAATVFAPGLPDQLGDIDGPLSSEEANHQEVSIHADWGWGNAVFSAYSTHFDNFIFLEERPVLGFESTAIYVEREARIQGLEGLARFALWQDETDEEEVALQVSGDWIVGRDLSLEQELPRTPPPKVGLTLSYQSDSWDTYLEVRRSFGSGSTPPQQGSTPEQPLFEFGTSSYTLVNAGATWRPTWLNESFEISVRGTNLLNEEIREHTSFRKDTSPQPGRGVSVELKWGF